MKKITTILMASSIGLALHAQSLIDPLTGSLSGYTTTMILDNSDGAGQGISFSDSASGLQANYVGTGTSAEQAVLLAPTASFSTVFSVGDTLYVNAALTDSATTEDLGLAIAATATPTAAGSGNSYNSRTAFDWASISLRPSQTAVRVNSSISGTLTTSAGAVNVGNVANVTELFITWNSADSFSLGYISNNVSVVDSTLTFASGSTIGAAIGFYGDLRATGTSLADLSDLTIVPEPSTVALCGVGLAGLVTMARRQK